MENDSVPCIGSDEPTSEAWEVSIKVQKRSNWRHFDVSQVSQMDSNWSSEGAVASQTSTLGSMLFHRPAARYHRSPWKMKALSLGGNKAEPEA
jgi:hypothetical protein